MPEFDFYITKTEVRSLIDYAFELGMLITPNLDYEKPNTIHLNSITDYDKFITNIEGNVLLFLTHKDFSKEGFLIGNFERDEKTLYYISQKYGGPYIDIFFSQPKDKKPVCKGFISYYPFYYHLDGSKNPDIKEIPNYYKLLCSFLKKTSNRTKIGKRHYYISNLSKQVLEQRST